MNISKIVRYFTQHPTVFRVLVSTIFIVVWVAVSAVGGPYFGKISEVATNDQSSFLPVDAESTQVTNRLKAFRDDSSVPAIIVFSNESNNLSNENIGAIASATDNLTSLPEVTGDVSPPIISDNKEAAFVAVNVASDEEFKDTTEKITKLLDDESVGVTYYISGPVGFSTDLSKAFSGIDGLLLGVALSVVFIILLIVYRSPILPFVVLLTSIVALSAAILVVYYLAKADIIRLNGQVQGILFILVVGAATDYALLYVARYREELKRQATVTLAIIKSWKRSIEPIGAAGGTVIAGLLCLLLSDLASNQALGPVGAIGIAAAMLSALTFLPAALLAIGRPVFWPKIPTKEKINSKIDDSKATGIWPAVARFVEQHTRQIWIITTVLLLAACIGIIQLRADGVAQSDLLLGESRARQGQEILSTYFPAGSGTPAQILVPETSLEATVQKIDKADGVASLEIAAKDSPSGSMPIGEAEQKLKESIRQKIIASQGNSPAVDTIAMQAYPFKNAEPTVVNDTVLLQATLTDSSDSEAAQNTVAQLRSSLQSVDNRIQIGGLSATQLDTKQSALRDQLVVIPAVLLVITVILAALLRSLLAPVLLLATTVLSFGATLGISALLFNHIWQFPGADPSVVLYGFIFLVALGIDYNIFLLTRVREESLKIGTKKGVSIGLIVTGGVITSAGIVLAATFAALAVIPILFLAQLAFIVAFGVLLDTIVVRSLLVPALVRDIGALTWWPFNNRIK